MADQEMEALVLKDAEGNFYVFDREAFERARVTDQALHAALDEEVGDSQGYALSTAFQGTLGTRVMPGIIAGGMLGVPRHPGKLDQLGGQGGLARGL